MGYRHEVTEKGGLWVNGIRAVRSVMHMSKMLYTYVVVEVMDGG